MSLLEAGPVCHLLSDSFL